MPKRSPIPPHDDQLRDVFRARYGDAEIPALLEDIKRGTDRTVCIILSAMIERNLEHLILSKIAPGEVLSNARRLMLFDKDGPLSTFSANIKMARALNLINSATEKDLNTIRRIRNIFAHTALPNLASPEIHKELLKLRFAGYHIIIFNEEEIKTLPEVRKSFVRSSLQALTDIVASQIMVDDFVMTIRNALTSESIGKFG
jgi:hypothetical protein